MEGMIGEFDVSVENETETAALHPKHPEVYVEDAAAASDDADGGFCIDEDGAIASPVSDEDDTDAAGAASTGLDWGIPLIPITTDAEPMAARTKADILLESLSLADEQVEDSFDFTAQITPAKGDSDGDGAADSNDGGLHVAGSGDIPPADSFDFTAPAQADGGDGDTGGGDGDPDDGSGGTDGGGGGGILIGLLLPAVAADHADDGADYQLDPATGMEPLTSHSEPAFVPEPDGMDGAFSIGLLDPSL